MARGRAGSHREQKEQIVEYTFSALEGNRHFQSRLVPEFAPDGTLLSLLNIARDITSLKQAEEKLRETQALLTALLEHAPIPIFVRATDGTQLLVNQAWEKLTGIPRDKIIGQPMKEHFPPDLAARFQRSDQAVLQRGDTVEFEEVIQGASSATRYFHTIKFPLYDSARQVSAVAGISMDITPVKQAQDALQNYNERLQILHEIDRKILAARSVAEIAQSVVMHLPSLLPCNRASVGVVDPQGKGLEILAVHVDQGTSFGVGNYFELGSGTLERILKTDAPYVTLDLDRYRRFAIIEAIRKSGLRWVTLFPIRLQGKLLATLNVASAQPQTFSDHHLAMARAVADSLAIALQQSQLNEALQRQREQLEVLRQVALELTAELDLDALLRSLVRHAIELCRGTAGGLYLYRPDKDVLEWVVAIGEGLMPLGSTLRRGEGLSGRVWEQGTVMAVEDYRTWPGRPAHYEQYSWQTVIAVPIRWGETLLGVLNLQRGSLPFTPEEGDLLSLFASQAAIALHNAHLFEAERRAHLHAEQIREATVAITSALDLDRVLAVLLFHLQKVVSYDSATVFLHQDDHLVAVAVRGHPAPDQVIGQRFPTGQGIFPLIQKTRQPIILDDAQHDERFMGWADTGYVRGWLAVPLIVRGVVIGYLTLDSREVGRYNQQAAGLVLTFASQAAVAIENARLFEAERLNRQQAEMLQAANAALTKNLDLQRVLAQLLIFLKRMIPFDSASVQLLEEPSRVVTRAVHSYEPWAVPEQILGLTVDASPGTIIHDIFSSGKSYRIADTREEERWQYIEQTSYIRSWLGVPLIAGGEWIGIYAMDKAEPNFFTEEHVRLAESLAAPAAVAIQNAKLFEEVEGGRRRLQMLSTQLIEVQENERRHIARELHDEIGQILMALSLRLEMGARAPLESSQSHLQQARALISDLITRVDALSLDLRPSMLDDLGLLPALLWHFERYEAQSGVHVHFKQSGLADTRFDSVVETAAYRIVQEALTNVARHAGVNTVWVRVVTDRAVIHIQVRDEGKGFNPDSPNEARESRGLIGIYERATLLGGMLLVQSQIGQGTLLTVVLPVDGKHAQRDHTRGP